MDDSSPAQFEQHTELTASEPTLIEGLPGHGLVASIAVDQVTDQLGLDHHGSIHSDDFPPVATFQDGRIQDVVRVYAGQNPDVMTLQSGIQIPEFAFDSLSKCVLNDLAEEFSRAIFIAGAPAENEEDIGDIAAAATNQEVERDLIDADIPLAEGSGAIGGVTGGLTTACYQENVPAAILIVKANPYLPDPAAARSVIENALEPLVEFDIDTTELEEQAEEIQRRKQQIAEQLREQESPQEGRQTRGMYQ